MLAVFITFGHKSYKVMSKEVKIIGVIGPNRQSCTDEIYKFGLELGKYLVDSGYTIVNGGKEGLMEAVFKGAHNSDNYSCGRTIAIIPEDDGRFANKYSDIVIPTGQGVGRNLMIVNTADVVIAVGGGAGTLSELALAWQKYKHVLCHTGFGGWSEKLANETLDGNGNSLMIPVNNFEDLKNKLKTAVKEIEDF